MFVALDFETATSDRSSICEVGITIVKDGKIEKSLNWLVQPKDNYYEDYNSSLHGITANDTIDSPTFPEVWKELKPYLDGNTVVAHNTSFDMYALRDALDNANLEYPTFDYYCSLRLAKYVFPGFYSYSLPVIAPQLGIEYGVAHKANNDSIGCAMLFLKCLDKVGLTIDELEEKFNFKKGRFAPNTFLPQLANHNSGKSYEDFIKTLNVDTSKIDQGNYFFGKNVCFTGTCKYGQRKDLLAKVAEIGGIPIDSVTKKTDVLVVGQQDYRVVGADGMSSKQKKALDLLSKGQQIEILSESEFLDLI